MSTLYAFGSNDESQLGLGAASKVLATPTKLYLPSQIRDIKGGSNHTLIVSPTGTVWGAGEHTKGQLGHVTSTTATRAENETSPELGRRLVVFERLHDDIAFCAVTNDTSAYIWIDTAKDNGNSNLTIRPTLITEGYGHFGELGRGHLSTTHIVDEAVEGTLFDGVEPVNFHFPCDVVDFAGGCWHYVAVLKNGEVWGWGKNRFGQVGPKVSMGNGDEPNPKEIRTPTKLEGIPFAVKRAVCGKDFTYLVGDPASGEHLILGRDQYNLKAHTPKDIENWKDIGATWSSIFVLFQDGSLQGWGKENQWKLIPPNLPPLSQVAVGSEHVLALTKEDNKLISWGWGFHGNCGELRDDPRLKPSGVVSGWWNEIEIEGHMERIWAGYCTSFVSVKNQNGGT
ncbi:RCC1/BLIP-II [Polyplosphaeria fusca]|uniref:RCC1/BLIP-II n=1 Tax=Polyplosphaeria fusca TaxID=682080 RepID=A0A9P4UW88_9PLEO|nr:RCC1/BLIP-II [Polyplosphaeria fusca]